MEKIDFVVLWVDGNDRKWQEEKNRYTPQEKKTDTGANRYRDWGLMKYWFRGVEKFAPWVNKIYFVTYGHLPDFLNLDCPKLQVVRHEEFIPQEYLPTFSGHPIELNLHRIEGLSEQFVYFNDDMFLCKPVKPTDFFRNGLPCEEGVEGGSNSPGDGNIYYHILLNDVDMINRNFSKREVQKRNFGKYFNWHYGKDNLRNLCLLPWHQYAGFKNAHVPAAYLKKTLQEVWEKEGELLRKTCRNKFRSIEDVNQYVFRYWQLVTGEFSPRGALGMRYDINEQTIRDIERVIKRQRYRAVCLNDPEQMDTFDAYRRRISSAFEEILPSKSEYEV